MRRAGFAELAHCCGAVSCLINSDILDKSLTDERELFTDQGYVRDTCWR